MSRFATFLLITALIASIVPPGYSAYIGAYVTLSAGLLSLLVFGWPERATFAHPSALAILAAIALVAATVPFVYRSEQDILAPILMLPMLVTIAIGLLARPTHWMPSPAVFATICLMAAALALTGGAYEHFVLGIGRVGLGNNPIHYGSLAAMAGGLALIGAVSGTSPKRFIFLLGPLLGLASAVLSGSRGPTGGALFMIAVGVVFLSVWLWRDRWFRLAFIATAPVGAIMAAYVIGTNSSRVVGLLEGASDIFRFTGGSDDIRAALYGSALQALHQSPLVGMGLGQIMLMAETLYPELVVGTGLENLHADWANMAAMAGGMGLMAWLLFLSAPLLLLLDARARQDRPIVLGAALLVAGQIAFGLSNATFGVLPQTLIYAAGIGYFLARARRLSMGLN